MTDVLALILVITVLACLQPDKERREAACAYALINAGHFLFISWWIDGFWYYISAAVALVSDVLFNFVFGTVSFLELPQEWLFTYRCSRHLKDRGWRGKIARWFCRNFMDPFDPDGRHCV